MRLIVLFPRVPHVSVVSYVVKTLPVSNRWLFALVRDERRIMFLFGRIVTLSEGKVKWFFRK